MNSNMQVKKITFPRNPILLVIAMALLHLFWGWPGTLSPDSQTQYAMALSGVYTDHHPPLMSFVWRYLDKIYAGPGMMFLLHILLLYASVFHFLRSLQGFSVRFLLLLFPFIPQVFIYSDMIWKDVGFAFSFLFVAAYLTQLTRKQEPLGKHNAGFLFLILLYGAAIKFQAQYCAPVLLAWMVYSALGYQRSVKKFLTRFIITCLVFYSSLSVTNYLLIPNVTKSHAWQYVKLYDLSAISVATHQAIFPQFAKTERFNLPELIKRFNHQRVDDLVFVDPILRIGTTESQRKELYSIWLNAAIHHPLIYLKHRFMNIAYILISRPGFSHIPPLIEKLTPPSTTLYKSLYATTGALFFLTMSHLIPVILAIIYFILGIASWRIHWSATPLVYLNGTGLSMIFVLFFCAMAGTPRYSYITICLLHASHAFAYLCFQARRKVNRSCSLPNLNGNCGEIG